MDEKKKSFLARLRQTFRAEAADHLQAISAGLVACERADAAERTPLVEGIFREAHSLKGAARSVSLPAVEAICRELETVFASLKRGELAISTALLDALLPVVELVADLCANPDAPRSPEVQAKDRRALATLKKASDGEAIPPGQAPPADEPTRRARPAPPAPMPPPPADDPRHPPQQERTPQETVRVSAQTLGAILLETEKLVGAKLAGGELAAELRRLLAEVGQWNLQRGRLSPSWSHGRANSRGGRGPGAPQAPARTSTDEIDHLERDALQLCAFENSLRNLSRLAQRDAHALGLIADALLDETRKALLLPCAHLLDTFPQLVREWSRAQGKEAELVLRGASLEIDRRILDALKDPFIHLLRNAVDHGIEKPDVRADRGKTGCGTITIAAMPVPGSRVEFTIADDGAGVDLDRVRKTALRLGFVTPDEAEGLGDEGTLDLIFHSGLSTSPILTDLSGRGLGMAIIREKIEKIGGTVTVTSTPGAGSTFRLLAPLTLATFRGVLVEAAGRRFVIPSAGVIRVARVRPEEIRTVENRPTLESVDGALSLARLRDVLGLSGPEPREGGAARAAVVARAAGRQVAFLVDAVLGEQEVTVKPLGRHLVRVRNIEGAAIEGDGAVVPILSVLDLVESAIAAGAPLPAPGAAEIAVNRCRRLLVAEDSITSRTLLKSILEGAGYEVTTAVDGLDALTKFKTEAFDLVVSDVDMPRMNGFELTSRIRADRKLEAVPVILVTALGTQEDREYGIEVGANAYLVKSDFDQGNLLEIIRRLL